MTLAWQAKDVDLMSGHRPFKRLTKGFSQAARFPDCAVADVGEVDGERGRE
jgi:hypothetical protein